jgi:hypothetical protein
MTYTILPAVDSNATNPGSVGNTQRLALDTLLRRELKVGDPNDAQQVANALLDRYQNDARAKAIGGEAQGLPFLYAPSSAPAAPMAPTATCLDLDQARDDVNQDLQHLLTTNLTKDVRPELEGWQQTLYAAIDEGVSAARQGLDPYSRDRAFAVRRQLGEYARLARLVGAMNSDLNDKYRNLAQSLDEVSAVLLVLMGESLANTGFAGGRYLLCVPYSELQARRDRVLVALRNLSGSAQESLDQNVMPRGLAAYRELFNTFETQGQSDLRALLSETQLARAMDEMIQLSAGGSSNGLRRTGATAWSSLGRFMRFVQVTLHMALRDAPPLLAFQDSLQLFIDGFEGSGGYRLLRIARPSVLMYGLYGSAALTKADLRLMQLVQKRGEFATAIDCLTRCACDDCAMKTQIVLDRVLFDIDRATDLYAIGETEFGIPEQRAAACGFLMSACIEVGSWTSEEDSYALHFESAPMYGVIRAQLLAFRNLLMPPLFYSGSASSDVWETAVAQTSFGGNSQPTAMDWLLRNEMALQLQTDRGWRLIAEQMSTGCLPVGEIFNEVEEQRGSVGALDPVIQATDFGTLMAFQHGALLLLDQKVTAWKHSNGEYRERRTFIPPMIDSSVNEILDVQRRLVPPKGSAGSRSAKIPKTP